MKYVRLHTLNDNGSPENRKQVLRIGVTGGIGSGKSVVCSILQECGIPLIEADRLARILMVHDAILKYRIIAEFGEHIYHADGSLNRQAMARIIFSNPDRRKQLEAIVHPRVISEVDRLLGDIDNAPYAVVEAALIYEAGLDRNLDYIIVVDADERLRIARIHERDGTAGEEIRQRMNAQMSTKEKRKRADFTIINNGTFAELRKQVLFVHTILIGLARRIQKGEIE